MDSGENFYQISFFLEKDKKDSERVINYCATGIFLLIYPVSLEGTPIFITCVDPSYAVVGIITRHNWDPKTSAPYHFS